MKMHLRLASASPLAVLCLAVAILPAAAADITLYSNGPAYSNDTTAWPIGPPHGPFVTNSFYIGASSTVTAVSFAVWVPISDTPAYVEYSIGTASFGNDEGGGAMYLSNFSYLWSNSSSLCLPVSPGCDVYEVTGTVSPSVSLATGTYWLTLAEGSTTGGERLLWDQNDNGNGLGSGGVGCTGWSNSGVPCPSLAYTDIANPMQIASEDPDIIGHLNNPVPEPGSILLFGSGILGFVGLRGRKLRE